MKVIRKNYYLYKNRCKMFTYLIMKHIEMEVIYLNYMHLDLCHYMNINITIINYLIVKMNKKNKNYMNKLENKYKLQKEMMLIMKC